MTKFDWSKARRYGPIRTQDAADRWLAQFWENRPRTVAARKRAQKPPGPPPNLRGKNTSAEICIVIGSDRSPTGQRQVFIFPDVAAAHRAGYTWAI